MGSVERETSTWNCVLQSYPCWGEEDKGFLRQTKAKGFVSADLAWEMCSSSGRNLELHEERQHAWEEIMVAFCIVID